MSLQVWLPLNGDLRNQGLNNMTFSNTNTTNIVEDSNGKLGKCYKRTTKQTAGRIISNTTINLSADFSMCCWAKVTDCISSANGLVSNHSHADNTGFGITVREMSTTDYRISCNTGSGSDRTYNTYYGTSNIKDAWHHLAITYDKDNTQLKLWVDGICENTIIYNGVSKADYIILFDWSTTYDSYQYRPAVAMNDVRIYDHALSPLEVKRLAQGLVLHYPLSDASNDAKRNLAPASYWAGTKTITLSANTNNYRFINSPTVDVNTNTTYFWTVDIRVVSGGENLTLVAIDTNCTGGSYSGNDSAHTVVTIQNPNLTELKAGKWQTVYCITTVKSDATNPKIFHSIFGKSSTSVNAVIEWRNLMLVESNNIVPFRAWHSDIVYDTSGFCNNGTVNGQFSISTDTPRYNVSTYASGSASTYLSGSTLPAEAKTVSLWIKCNKTVNSAIFSDKTSGLQIGLLNSLLYINSLASTPGFTTTHWVNDEWNHVVAINDNGSRSVYINGQPETQSGASNYYIHNNDNFYLWKRAYNDSYTYTGALSDLRIYATALSADDVMALYKNAGYVDSDGNVYAYEMTE